MDGWSLPFILSPRPASTRFPTPVPHTSIHWNQTGFVEIHPSSLFNRTVRSVVQHTQCEIKCYPKPLPFLSFSLFPFQNDRMNGISNRETNGNNHNYFSTIRMKWVLSLCYSTPILHLQPFRCRLHFKRIRLISENETLCLWNNDYHREKGKPNSSRWSINMKSLRSPYTSPEKPYSLLLLAT